MKLKLECKGPDFSTTVGCLLFKLQGSTSCELLISKCYNRYLLGALFRGFQFVKKIAKLKTHE